MYQMSPDLPRQLYADVVQSRAQERFERRAARTTRSSAPSAFWLPALQAFGKAVVKAVTP
jgi:hypothetical protein